MFSIAVNLQYPTPVVVEIPNGNGKSTKHSFTVHFKRLSQSELDEIHRRLNPAKLNKDEELLKDDELLQQVLVGWEGVGDKDGAPLSFNEANMAALLDIYPTRPTLVNAFFGSIKTSARKKLEGAAEWWGRIIGGANDDDTGPRVVSEELAEDMAFFGAADEIAAAPREGDIEPERYPVWPDNWPTLKLFLRLHSKWNVVAAPDGELVRTGIWWPNIEGALRNTNGIPRRRWPEIIADLEAMEDAALRVMNKAREARRAKRLAELEAARGTARNSR